MRFGGGGRSQVWDLWGYFQNNFSGDNTSFASINAGQIDTLEADIEKDMKMPITVIRHEVSIDINSKDGDSLFAVRDDGVNVGLITVGAGLTGNFSLDDIDVIMAEGSQVNLLRDTSASTGGNLEFNALVTVVLQ